MHCLSPYTCKRCTIFKQFDGLNFDGLAGERQKHQNFPPDKIFLYMVPSRPVYRYKSPLIHITLSIITVYLSVPTGSLADGTIRADCQALNL